MKEKSGPEGPLFVPGGINNQHWQRQKRRTFCFNILREKKTKIYKSS